MWKKHTAEVYSYILRYRGEIKINGRDARDITIQDLRSTVGCILQDMLLFDENIPYNILYGRPEAQPCQVFEACVEAGLSQVIRRRGFYSNVGHRGKFLSGGEMQMISLARCFPKGVDIMLLDEVTAKLDPRSESKFFILVRRIQKKTISWCCTGYG